MIVSRRITAAAVASLVAGVLLWIGTSYFSPTHRAEARMKSWLRTIEHGEADGHFWTEPKLADSFYAPRSHQILHSLRIDDSNIIFTVRLDSSTKGGHPVIANWSVWMKKVGGDWKVDNITGE